MWTCPCLCFKYNVNLCCQHALMMMMIMMMILNWNVNIFKFLPKEKQKYSHLLLSYVIHGSKLNAVNLRLLCFYLFVFCFCFVLFLIVNRRSICFKFWYFKVYVLYYELTLTCSGGKVANDSPMGMGWFWIKYKASPNDIAPLCEV